MPEKLKRYDREQDVHMRIDSTYLRYKGKAYYCAHRQGMDIELYRFTDAGPIREHLLNANDPDLDVSSVPLGYMNLPRGPVYLTREAARRQKQGVHLGNISGFDEKTRQWFHPISRGFPINRECIFHVIENEYPDVSAAMKKKEGAAFHRRLCLIPLGKDKKWKLKYMSQFVGLVTSDGKAPIVRLVNNHSGNSFLRSILEQKGVYVHD